MPDVTVTITPPSLVSVGATITPPAPIEVEATISPPVTAEHLAIYQPLSAKGAASGYAGLDGTGKVPTAQLPAAATGAATAFVATNNEPAATIYAGQAVATSASGGVVLASLASTALQAVGIAETTAAPGAELTVVALGIAEVADWTQATGAAWLPANTKLWLGVSGLLTTTPGATSGQYHQSVGVVIDPYKIVVQPSRIIILT